MKTHACFVAARVISLMLFRFWTALIFILLALGATPSVASSLYPLYSETYTPSHPKGTVILIHGGGWLGSSSLSKQTRPFAKVFLKNNWRVVNVDHSTGQSYQDILGWYDKITAAYPGPICAAGQSSGGHLALLLADSRPLDCVISEGGPVDLSRLSPYSQTLAILAFGPTRLAHYSPINRTIPPSTKVLLGHFKGDKLVPVSQILSYNKPRSLLDPGNTPWVHGSVDKGDLIKYKERVGHILKTARN